MRRKINKMSIPSEGSTVTVAIGDVVTIHTLNGGGMGGCEIMRFTNQSIHYTQDAGKHVKTLAYKNILTISK